MGYWTKTEGLGGRIKATPEDFFVEELYLEKPGKNLIATMEKRNLTTIEAIDIVSKTLEIPASSIGFAGLKDKLAVTRQAISLGKIGPSLAEKITDNPKLLDFRYGGDIYPGDLKGNFFRITIREIKKSEDKIHKIIKAFAKEASKRGIPNYFGEQRFGHLDNNHEIGKEILLKQREEKRFETRRFLINAYQSYLFNVCLERYLKKKKSCKNFQAPLIGFTTKLGDGEFDRIAKKLMEEENISLNDFRNFGITGHVRSVLIKPEIKLERIEKNGPGNWKNVTIIFALGPGEYATVVLKELMK